MIFPAASGPRPVFPRELLRQKFTQNPPPNRKPADGNFDGLIPQGQEKANDFNRKWREGGIRTSGSQC